MIYVVLLFLGISLLLYVLMAGADFGAGIVELFSSKENQAITKKTIYRVIGPVWEANHIWIIIMVVILWVGFPVFYNVIMVSLHIPLAIMLLGITLRGVAFVFRHYDAYQDWSQNVYNWMFRISSLITPIFLGICFGALLSEKISIYNRGVIADFTTLYVVSWFNGFSILVGLFFASLCAFLSSVLLIGEASQEYAKVYIKKASIATVVVVIIGFITLSYGFYIDNLFVNLFTESMFAKIPVVISALLLFPLWKSIKKGRRIFSRFYAGVQVLLILLAAIVPLFPNLILTTSEPISILENNAPDSVIQVLGISLIIGGTIIIPGLIHLLKSFKLIKILERN